jgi:hypothetical protein
MLSEWGARLFYPIPKGKGGGGGGKMPLLTTVAALTAVMSPTEVRSRVRSTVAPGATQVMVRITGGGRGMKAIAAHFRYIGRQGKEEVGGKGKTLEIEDEGAGVPEELMEKIWDPFFTTKEMGKGTGLGLATVYGIVKQNNGAITLNSQPGLGTVFRVYIPRHHRDVTEHHREATATELPRGNGETILIVEDEPAILEMGTTMLLTRMRSEWWSYLASRIDL